MLPFIRRARVSIALLALVLFAVAPVAAAEPDEFVADASVTVLFVDPDGVPIPAADVRLVAKVTDFPEDPPLAILDGTTDAAGQATFEQVPRAAEGAPVVHLAIEGQREDESTDANGCRTVLTWSGHVDDVVSPPAEPVVITATVASSLHCRTLAGRIVDADGEVHPADRASSFIEIVRAEDGSSKRFPLELAEDGTFRQLLPAWGSFGSPAAVRLVFVSVAEKVVDGDCWTSFAELASWQAELALETDEAPFLELVTQPVEGGTCGAVSATPQPAITLPPTDVAGGARSSSVSAAGALVAVGLLLVVSGLAATAEQGSRRRR